MRDEKERIKNVRRSSVVHVNRKAGHLAGTVLPDQLMHPETSRQKTTAVDIVEINVVKLGDFLLLHDGLPASCRWSLVNYREYVRKRDQVTS